jgi:putative hydrolase of the HAD superfamily
MAFGRGEGEASTGRTLVSFMAVYRNSRAVGGLGLPAVPPWSTIPTHAARRSAAQSARNGVLRQHRQTEVRMSSFPEIAGVRGVVFDAVGTLIDPRPAVAEVYAEAARRQGVALDAACVRPRFRAHFAADESDEAAGPLATDEAAERRRWRRIVAGCLPEVPDPERAFDELWDHFARPDSWQADPEAEPTLTALAGAGLRLGIASNFDARLRPVLRGLPGLAAWAGRAVISSEVGRRKPHPAFYRAACAALGLPPGAVLYVGDDPENDGRGPIAAGLRAVLLDRGARPCPGPPPRIGRLADLPGLLDAGPFARR